MEESEKDSTRLRSQSQGEKSCPPIERAHEGERRWDEVEYVIDEYWDEKFGLQFGLIDWRSLGLGC